MPQRDVRPTPVDGFPTETSRLQASTEVDLRTRLDSILANDATPLENSSPILQRDLHLSFLLRNLRQGFPIRYVSQDASQPWLIFWTLQGFGVLGVGLDDQTKQRYE